MHTDKLGRTVLTGVFLFVSTTARSSNALLGWNCGYSLTSNIMYGVIYALSPELFPTKDRGTGNALVACANRIFGIMVGPVPPLNISYPLRLLLHAPAPQFALGADNRVVFESPVVGADIHIRSAFYHCGPHRLAITVRTPWKSVTLNFPSYFRNFGFSHISHFWKFRLEST